MTSEAAPSRIPPGIDASEGVKAQFMTYGPTYRWWVTATSMLGSFASLLTGTIINVAIPDVMGALGMAADEAQWLATGFLAATTVTMLLSAWAIESFGMARTFIAAIGVFLLGSVMGGLATTGEMLITSRVIQGAGSGLMIPLAMVIIFQVFPVNRRGTAMGIYSVGVVLAPALGPALGGWLIDHLNWRYVFFIAIPFAGLSIPMAALFMPPREADARSPAFDWTGAALLTGFLVALLTTLSNGAAEGWGSDFIALTGYAALASGIAFIYWELRARDPMINLRLFTNGRFLAACIVTFVLGAGLFGSTYLLPLFLQTIQGITATDSGLLLVPAGLIMAVTFPIAGRLSDSVAPRNLIIFGIVLFAYSSFLFARIDLNTPFATMIYWLILGRIGLACIFPCLNATALRPLSLEQLAQGSGIVNFLRQLGGAFGVNLLTIYLQQRTSLHVSSLTTSQTPANENTRSLMDTVGTTLHQAGANEALAAAGGNNTLVSILMTQGSSLAFRDAFLVVAVVFVLCLVPAALLDSRAPRG